MIGWIPAPFFAVNIIGWEGMWDSFARWGYPSWFHLLNGVLQLVIAVLLVMDTTRLPGLGLGILFCLAIVATLIRHQEKAVPDLAHQRIVAVPARHALLVANGEIPLTIHGGHFVGCLCHALGELQTVTARLAATLPEVVVHETSARVHASAPDQILVAVTKAQAWPASTFVAAARPATSCTGGSRVPTAF